MIPAPAGYIAYFDEDKFGSPCENVVAFDESGRALILSLHKGLIAAEDCAGFQHLDRRVGTRHFPAGEGWYCYVNTGSQIAKCIIIEWIGDAWDLDHDANTIAEHSGFIVVQPSGFVRIVDGEEAMDMHDEGRGVFHAQNMPEPVKAESNGHA